MHKIGIIGDRESVIGLNAAIEARVVKHPREAARELNKMVEEEFAVIYITEQTAQQIEAEIEKYKGRIIPAIIPVPGIQGNTGMGMKGIKRLVEKAVGADILFKDGI